MAISILEAEFGSVVARALTYPYRAVLPSQRTLGQRRAFLSAQGWTNTILDAAYRPKGDIEELLHNHTPTTCDAVQVHYKIDDAGAPTEVALIQTLYVVILIVQPGRWPGQPGDSPVHMASLLAKRVFSGAERIYFRQLREENGIAIGEQIVQSGKVTDWLDTIRWWFDGTNLGFAILKSTGPNQAAKPSRDFQPNQVWFRKYETPRTR